MSQLAPYLNPDQWLRTVFAADMVNKGGVIRRSLRDVDRITGRERFAAELERRGFRAIINAGQVIVFCNHEPILRFTAGERLD